MKKEPLAEGINSNRFRFFAFDRDEVILSSNVGISITVDTLHNVSKA